MGDTLCSDKDMVDRALHSLSEALYFCRHLPTLQARVRPQTAANLLVFATIWSPSPISAIPGQTQACAVSLMAQNNSH
jgi:hypothetical protein